MLPDGRSSNDPIKTKAQSAFSGVYRRRMTQPPSSLINTAEEHRPFIKEQLKIIP